jgi:hypothetical protein
MLAQPGAKLTRNNLRVQRSKSFRRGHDEILLPDAVRVIATESQFCDRRFIP